MIRRAGPGDSDQLARLHIETWRAAYSDVFPADFLDSLDIDARVSWFTRIIERGQSVLVAVDGSEVAGFCLVGESSEPGWGELYAIYVHPDQWGQGHGYRLMEAAEEELMTLGFRRAMLWVLESNRQARWFYERQGWTVGKPMRLEEIGGVQVTEVRYERELRGQS